MPGEEDQHVRVTEDLAFISNIIHRFKACRVAFSSLEMDPFSPIAPAATTHASAPSPAAVIDLNSSSSQSSAPSPSSTAAAAPPALLSKLKSLRDDEIPEDIILKAAVQSALSNAAAGTVPLSIPFAAIIGGVDVVNPVHYTYRGPRGVKGEVKNEGAMDTVTPEKKEEMKKSPPSIFDTPHALILCMRSCGLAAPAAFSKAHSVNQRGTITKQVNPRINSNSINMSMSMSMNMNMSSSPATCRDSYAECIRLCSVYFLPHLPCLFSSLPVYLTLPYLT